MKEKKDALKKEEPTNSERFSLMVEKEFSSSVGVPQLTERQKRLCQHYFIATDVALKMAEDKRLKKSSQYRDNLEVSWKNVNMVDLALKVVAFARVGLDPALKNHINMMPFKNNTTNKYDIVFIEGYRGKELVAKKYAYEPPKQVIHELVFKNDHFKPIKIDANHEFETYEFVPAENPFDRGEIVGGFYYHKYDDREKNKIVWVTKADIEKRKPQYASVEFWGGEKYIYKDGKKTGEKEQVEGWYEKMMWKTVVRMAYDDFTLDAEN
jgi:recombination protein RecT